MSTFYLIRHGLRESQDENTHLNEAGVKQAEMTGQYFGSKNIHYIFVSPAERTLQTARILNNYLQVPQSTDNRLKERMVYKPVCGTYEAFLEEWDKTMADRDYEPTHGDSARFAGDRITSLLDELCEDKNYLLISHGGTIGDAVRNLFADSLFTLTTDSIKKIQWLDIPECSVTEIQKIEGRYLLQRVGDTSHLV
ncbi:histidine phosphatase family protein [Candidatus Woesebacteria bacterium]|nr:histidine phosphatase family protein [Candidatus Woesebacteria bacterium]